MAAVVMFEVPGVLPWRVLHRYFLHVLAFLLIDLTKDPMRRVLPLTCLCFPLSRGFVIL